MWIVRIETSLRADFKTSADIVPLDVGLSWIDITVLNLETDNGSLGS
jgi:hypothetical protein